VEPFLVITARTTSLRRQAVTNGHAAEPRSFTINGATFRFTQLEIEQPELVHFLSFLFIVILKHSKLGKWCQTSTVRGSRGHYFYLSIADVEHHDRTTRQATIKSGNICMVVFFFSSFVLLIVYILSQSEQGSVVVSCLGVDAHALSAQTVKGLYSRALATFAGESLIHLTLVDLIYCFL